MIHLSLLTKFFDNKGNLKVDSKGEPLLKSTSDLAELIEELPHNQMPDVTKLFHLDPADVGVLHSGTSIIGDKTIKNIIEEFLSGVDIRKYLKGNYTISGITQRLFSFVKALYDTAFKRSHFLPELDLIVSGYSKKQWQPEVWRIILGKNPDIKTECERGQMTIVLGGQMDVISRVVLGVDGTTLRNLSDRIEDIKLKYHQILTDFLKEKNLNLELPRPSDFEEELALIAKGDWPFNGISARHLSNFSEQAAIDFVDFLVNIMIKAQQFSNQISTVGGEVQLALISKAEGFKWISKQEYKYKDYGVAKHDKKRN